MSCPDCFTGHVHSGTPKGITTTLHGLDVYITEPAPETAVKGIIVIIPDAFGWEFVNIRLLADRVAELGAYRVYLPDFMAGKTMPSWMIDTTRSLLKWNTLSDWITKPYHIACALYTVPPFFINNRFAKAWPIIQTFFTLLRQNEGLHLPIGAMGYCWGGKYTVTLAHGYTTDAEVDDGKTGSNSRPLIDAGFTGHPSLLDLPVDIENIRIPVSMAVGEKDRTLSMEQVGSIRGILEEKEGGELGEVKVYPGAGHGFCVRADTVLVDAERQETEAMEQALDWFNRCFAKVT